MKSLSVIVPVFNEETTIRQVLSEVRKQSTESLRVECIVVDDASTDGTAAVLAGCTDLYTKLVTHPRNRGKGAAVISGLEVATGDFVLVQDADLEYSPSEYPKLMQPALEFGAELVLGSRFLAPAWTRVNYFWHKVGNRIITLVFNILNNTTFTDVYCGMILFDRSLVQPSELKCAGWAQHAEILSRALARTKVTYEVSISYTGRTYAEGKKIRARHMVSVIWTIFSERMRRLVHPSTRPAARPPA